MSSLTNNIVSKLKKFGHWLDDHLLIIVSGWLLAFIPLYPKLPLFEAIPGYIVRVRLEDLLVLASVVIWLIKAWQKKVNWQSPIFLGMAIYAVIGLLSVIQAAFIIKTVPLQPVHLGKTLLHYFRYLEYFSLFVITFSAIKTQTHIKILLTIFSCTVLAIAVYGYGQKYLYWPVFSTMNREFSKGVTLYLTDHARVQSTFGGHYDLAAYLVIALNLLLALAFLCPQKLPKIGYHLVHLAGVWLMILSASRTSFIAYLSGAYLIILLIALQKKGWLKKIGWAISRGLLLTLTVTILMLSVGDDMYERFLQVLQGYPQVNVAYHQANAWRKKSIETTLVWLGIKEIRVSKPENGIAIDNSDLGVLTATDERPTQTKPSDVYVDVPDQVLVATTSATGETQMITVERDRTWSANAIKYGLSLGIRLDTLWPNAIAGLMKNPLLGSGYATLNKEGTFHFTEAESTDNNFLRTLGETGILGFISFYGIIVLAMILASKFMPATDYLTQALSVGFIGASVGLLLNATYIDVFAASKVAFTYWSITGLVIANFFIGKNWLKLKQLAVIKKTAALFHQLTNHH